jgi:hypothetical protein
MFFGVVNVARVGDIAQVMVDSTRNEMLAFSNLENGGEVIAGESTQRNRHQVDAHRLQFYICKHLLLFLQRTNQKTLPSFRNL